MCQPTRRPPAAKLSTVAGSGTGEKLRTTFPPALSYTTVHSDAAKPAVVKSAAVNVPFSWPSPALRMV
jgi:hypothetical protein